MVGYIPYVIVTGKGAFEPVETPLAMLKASDCVNPEVGRVKVYQEELNALTETVNKLARGLGGSHE